MATAANHGDQNLMNLLSRRSHLRLCHYHLNGTCKKGDSCDYYHHRGTPYCWINMERSGHWQNFAPHINVALEKDYCDPKKDKPTSLTDNVLSTALFFHPHIKVAKNSVYDEVKRLDSGLSAAFDKQPNCTRWLWYWQDDDGAWKEYQGQVSGSDAIEIAYRSGGKNSFHFQRGGFSYQIDFHQFTQTNNRTRKARKVARRPQFTERIVTSHTGGGGQTTAKEPAVPSRKWCFKTDDGQWMPYGTKDGRTGRKSSIDSFTIEVEFQKNKKGTMSFQAGPDHYIIDFTLMKQVNTKTGRERLVLRQQAAPAK